MPAAREPFSSPEVSTGMAGLGRHFDEDKLKSIFGK